MSRRRIVASRDVATKMLKAKQDKIEIYSFFPVDPHDCECQSAVQDLKDELAVMSESQRKEKIAEMGHFDCPRDKQGMTRYQIRCKNCKQIMGYVWATDKNMHDWCDFHYSQWTDGAEWYGCLTPNVSPIDGYLGIECTCGMDSRDFRANMTLPGKIAYEIELENKQGRKFGVSDSKYELIPVSKKQEIKSFVKLDRPSLELEDRKDLWQK